MFFALFRAMNGIRGNVVSRRRAHRAIRCISQL